MPKLIILFFVSALLFACNQNTTKEKKFDEDNYETTKETLAEKEKKNPARFLQVENRERKNIIGQTVVIGHFTNTATVYTYKDVQIKLSFFSKTGTQVDEGMETIYETIAPGKRVKFKTKYFAPKGTDSVSIKVIDAIGEIK